MLLQFSATQIRCQIYIRRLDGLSGYRAESCGDLVVKETCYQIVVGDIPARALPISQRNLALAYQIAVVTPQRGNVKRVDQIGERRVSSVAKQLRRFRDSVIPTTHFIAINRLQYS